MKKNSNDKSKQHSAIVVFFKSVGDYIKKKYPFLIIFFAGFLGVSAVNFYKVSTTESVAAFVLDDFEVGQISDRTIIAEKTLPPDEINSVSVQKGEKILKKGFPVTEEGYDKLKKIVSSPIYVDFRAFANSEIYLFAVAIMWYLFLAFLPLSRKVKVSEMILRVVFLVITYACAGLCGKLQPFSNPYSICVVIPASLFVLLSSILYGQLSTVVFSFVLSLAVLNATNWALPPFFFTIATTLCSSAIVRNISKRIDMIIASILLSFLNIVFVILIAVVFNDSLYDVRFVFFGVALNGILSGLLALGLLTPLEIMLNTSSVFRLMDLSDLNNAFMQNMLVQASGTYQHSMMVAQLAEKACREIGANFLVARVGAYYHDIGKIDQSEYFVENQRGENIHDSINPSLSVSVIRSHVKRGVEKARQLHLPQSVIDIIAEHHGNSVIMYFYNEAKEKDPTVSPEDFAYTGNPPSTRESGVVMLADTVEAACRTLENKSVSSLERFITKLVQGKIDHKQLDNCNLTFSDLTKIKNAFVQILAGYYHSRIEYPDQNNNGEQANNSNANNTSNNATAEPKTKSEKTKGEKKLAENNKQSEKTAEKSTEKKDKDDEEKNEKSLKEKSTEKKDKGNEEKNEKSSKEKSIEKKDKGDEEKNEKSSKEKSTGKKDKDDEEKNTEKSPKEKSDN